MKHLQSHCTKVTLVFIISVLAICGYGQNVIINTPGGGVVLPTLTVTQRDAIVNPPAGLMIFCTTCGELQVFNGVRWTTTMNTATCAQVILCAGQWNRSEWSGKNLSVTTYRNGDPIPEVTDPVAWSTLTTGAWCYVDNDPATEPIYGRLYNFYAVQDPRGLAPVGWHIPTLIEWERLRNCAGIGTQPLPHLGAGGALKETGTFYWASPNTGATNGTGFTARPAGYRYGGPTVVGQYLNGHFSSKTAAAFFWSATNELYAHNPANVPVYIGLYNNSVEAFIMYDNTGTVAEKSRDGRSVRLVHD